MNISFSGIYYTTLNGQPVVSAGYDWDGTHVYGDKPKEYQPLTKKALKAIEKQDGKPVYQYGDTYIISGADAVAYEQAMQAGASNRAVWDQFLQNMFAAAQPHELKQYKKQKP